MKRYIPYLLLLFCWHTGSASDTLRPKRLFLSIDAQQGILLNTHGVDVIRNYYVGFDVRLGIQTDDFNKDISESSFRYPKYGVGFYKGNMNEIILGDATQEGFGTPSAFYAFFSSPVYRNNWLTLNYDIGFGLSFRFKTYDPERRPYNTLIGTKSNGYISVGFDGQIKFPGHSSLGVGTSFRHFSNGSYQKPNSGINLIMATVSYQWGAYKNKDKGYSRLPIEPEKPSFEWNLSWSNAVRMLDSDFDLQHPHESRRWYCTTLSSAALVKVSHRRKFGIGYDLFYFDWGKHIIRYRAQQEGRTQKTHIKNNISSALFLAHEVGYKKFWAVTDVGFYLDDRVGDVPESPWIYERIGLKYQLSNRFFIGFYLKAHLVKADYLELAIGYSFIKNKEFGSKKRKGAN